MSLYDDLDIKSKGAENVSGWSSGIKLLQSQLQLKKASVTQPRRDQQRKTSLPPVIDLKTKEKEFDDIYPLPQVVKPKVSKEIPLKQVSLVYGAEYDWDVVDEYDPMNPNEYHKVVKELRTQRDRENEKDEKERDRKRKSRFNDKDDLSPIHGSTLMSGSGFAGMWHDDDDDEPIKSRTSTGAAIAPPPSLQEQNEDTGKKTDSGGFGSVAAKIMAKYGFKEGQGLGKQEQGMSSALQVEKTSKRGGRIIHEKDVQLPFLPPPSPPPLRAESPNNACNITEIIKNPTKVLLLKNMVGPGEVDDDLEPEVKDECNTKYGEVITTLIQEIDHPNPEERVRIFVKFKHINSALKALIDLNGRFFGGRHVKATFYDTDKFDNLELEEY